MAHLVPTPTCEERKGKTTVQNKTSRKRFAKTGTLSRWKLLTVTS